MGIKKLIPKPNEATIIASTASVGSLNTAENLKVVGSTLYKIIGSAFEPYKNFSNIAEVVASSAAMNVVLGSNVAITQFTASSIAMNAIAGSSATMTQVATSNSFVSSVIATGTALAAVTASSVAMNALMNSSIFIPSVVTSPLALSYIVKSSIACTAVASAFQSLRSTIISTVSASPLFTKTASLNVGSGAGNFDSNLNSNTIYIPVSCNDDNDTDYTSYHGFDISKSFVTISRHSGTVSVTTGVGLRGTRLVGLGSSVGYMSYDVYTAV